MSNNLFEESYPDLICTGCEILLSYMPGSLAEPCSGNTCPICGSDIVPCDRCVQCGGFFGSDELYQGFCKDCDIELTVPEIGA